MRQGSSGLGNGGVVDNDALMTNNSVVAFENKFTEICYFLMDTLVPAVNFNEIYRIEITNNKVLDEEAIYKLYDESVIDKPQRDNLICGLFHIKLDKTLPESVIDDKIERLVKFKQLARATGAEGAATKSRLQN